jgi:hypothetical protein
MSPSEASFFGPYDKNRFSRFDGVPAYFLRNRFDHYRREIQKKVEVHTAASAFHLVIWNFSIILLNNPHFGE